VRISSAGAVLAALSLSAGTEAAPAASAPPFRLFARSVLAPALPDTEPAPGEAEPAELRLAAAPGEFEAVLVCVRASVALSGLALRVGDLERSGGGRVSAASLRVQRIVPAKARTEGTPRDITVPEWLLPAETPLAELPAHRTASFWVTVRVPDDAGAGSYRGRLKVEARGLPSRSLPLRVEVRGFKLSRPTCTFAMLFTYEFRYLERYDPAGDPAKRRPAGERAGFVARGQAVVRDLAEHGMTAIFPHSSREVLRKGGRLELPDLEATLRAARENGMTGRPGFFVGNLVNAQYADVPRFDPRRDPALLREIAGRAAEIARAEGFREVLVLPSDEPNDADDRKLPVARKLLAAAQGVPGVRLAVTSGFDRYHALGALADLHQVSIFAGFAPLEKRAALRASGHEIWLYENRAAEGHDPAWSRFVFGFGGWRTEAAGITAWTWPSYTFAPYDDRPRTDDQGRAIPEWDESGRPINTVVWEAIREGIDDRRYLDTLAEAISRARALGEDAAAQEAEKTLREVRVTLSPDLSVYGRVRGPSGDPAPPHGREWFDATRETIARATGVLLERIGRAPSGKR
jgi:hypothetical protein